MCLQFHNHLRFADGHPSVRCKLLRLFLLSEADVDWAGQVRRLLELLLVLEHEVVIDSGVVDEDMVQEVEQCHSVVAEDDLA